MYIVNLPAINKGNDRQWPASIPSTTTLTQIQNPQTRASQNDENVPLQTVRLTTPVSESYDVPAYHRSPLPPSRTRPNVFFMSRLARVPRPIFLSGAHEGTVLQTTAPGMVQPARQAAKHLLASHLRWRSGSVSALW